MSKIHGYILLRSDYFQAVEYIKDLGVDNSYPFINTNMFSFGDYEVPYYYDNIIFSFGATYKEFGFDIEDINEFILKIEKILRNINFEEAKFYCNGFYGDFILYWISRRSFRGFKIDEIVPENEYRKKLIQTDSFYFEFKDNDNLKEFYNFKYPIE